jgi:hypothetical protein
MLCDRGIDTIVVGAEMATRGATTCGRPVGKYVPSDDSALSRPLSPKTELASRARAQRRSSRPTRRFSGRDT